MTPTAKDTLDWRTWVMGVLISTCFALVGVVYESLNERVEALAAELSPVRERLATTEALQVGMQRQLDNDIRELRETAKGINAKLDRLIEQRRQGP